MKFIIESRTKRLNELQVLKLIKSIVEMGRISNDGKQYCYATSFKNDNVEYMVFTDLNKKSDRFVITEYAVDKTKI